MTGIKTRKPSGQVPYPLILLEGEEKAGKSWAIAELSASELVGVTYWIDLAEGAADEYGAVPGARYEVVDHDGTFVDILGQVRAIKAEAARAKEAGEPPVVLAVDSATALWDLLKDWISGRARTRPANRKKLEADPAAELTITTDLWNDAASRYRRVMTELLTFPGVVVVTARGKEVVEMRDGRPVEGSKVWKVEGHKTLAYDATVWVRMTRDQSPEVIGARSVHAGIRPGRDKSKPIDLVRVRAEGRFLEWLIFDLLKVDSATAHARDLTALDGGELTEEDRPAGPAQAPGNQRPEPMDPAPLVAQAVTATAAQLDELARRAAAAHAAEALTPDGLTAIRTAVQTRRKALEAAATTTGGPS